MTYDEVLADRILEQLEGDPRLEQKKMFGGLAFLINGHMAIAASRQGGVLVRVDPAEADRLLDVTRAEPAVMGGRPMLGWLRVGPEHLRTKRQLVQWVRRGVDYAGSLPAKEGRVVRPKNPRPAG
jgi:TfoX/Sxy family transcriptional regulator of competence genes